jgi:hypothetical protein
MIVEQNRCPVANEHGLPNEPPLTRASCFRGVLREKTVEQNRCPVANEHGLPNEPPLTRASCFRGVLREKTAAGCRETHDIHGYPCKCKLVEAWSRAVPDEIIVIEPVTI